MIRRVHIKNYKSLKDVELFLRPITVIMGPNAAGKSNLLDALSLLSQSVTQANLAKAFEEHRGEPLETVFTEQGFKNQNGHGDISFEVDVEISKSVIDSVTKRILQMRAPYENQEEALTKTVITETCMRYRLDLRIDFNSGFVGVLDEIAWAMRKDWKGPKESRKAFIQTDKEKNVVHLRMEGQAHPKYFDVGLDHTLISTSFYEPHHPHLAALREELSRWRFFYLEPKRLMRDINPVKEVNIIGSRGENLAAFYNTLKHKKERQFDSISKSLRQIIPDLLKVDVARNLEGQLLLEVVEQGGKRSSRLISEGTLRLLGLAAIINSMNQLSVIGYEEPENGVHPRRIGTIANWLRNSVINRDTQWIINTHSPLLAQAFDNKDLFVCNKGDGGTQFTPFTSAGSLYRGGEIDGSFEERLLRGDFGG